MPPWQNVVLPVDPRGAYVEGVGLGRGPSLTDELRQRRREGRRGRGRRSDKKPRNIQELVESLNLPDYAKEELLSGEEDEDKFSVTSPGDWLSAAGKGLMGALDAIDTPRAFLFALAGETGQEIGKFIAPEKADEPDEGFRWQDVIEKTHNNASFLEAATSEERARELTEDKPWLAAASLAADIGLDPLNYLGVGLADDPGKVARSFSSREALQALGREGAERAAQKVLQRGTTSLSARELAAIGRRGGLYSKVPGTGPIGRLTRLDKLIEAASGRTLPRYGTIAARGTAVGDIASEAAQIARKPLNAVLRATAPLVEKGFAGSLPGLRAAVRRSDDPTEVVNALWTVTKEAEARGLSSAFRGTLARQLDGLIQVAKKRGVEGRTLWRALAGDADATARVGVENVAAFRGFLDNAREFANQRAGRIFVMSRENYTPRILTDEAKEFFGIRAQGRKGIQSMANRRKYGVDPGDKRDVFGVLLHHPDSPEGAGRSIETQIEDILTEKRAVQWFRDDAFEVLPEYVNRLSKQVHDEYLGNELSRLGIGRSIYDDVASEEQLREAVGSGKGLPTKARERRDYRINRLREAGVSEKTATRLSKQVARLERLADEARRSVAGTDIPRGYVALTTEGERLPGFYRQTDIDAWRNGPGPDEVRLYRGQANDELGNPLTAADATKYDRHTAETIGRWFTHDPILAGGTGGYSEGRVAAAGTGLADLLFVDVPREVAERARLTGATSDVQSMTEEWARGGEFLLDEATAKSARRVPGKATESLELDPSVFGENQRRLFAAMREAEDIGDDARLQELYAEYERVPLNQHRGFERFTPTVTEPPTATTKTPDAIIAEWDTIFAKARKAELSDAMKRALDDGFKQFGTNVTLPGNIVDELRSVGKMADAGAFGKLIGVHDRLLKMWRQMALLSPGYHWRNSFGGVYMNWLGDVDEGRYRQFLRLTWEDPQSPLYHFKAAAPLVAGVKIDDQMRAGYAEARRLGIFHGGQTVTDVEIGKPTGSLSRLNPFRRSHQVAGGIEHQLRGTMFLDEFLKNGGDATEAFAKTQKYHFDYENLGNVERKIRQAVPFYTWTRRSVPLMLEMIVRNPAKINRYFRIKDNVEMLSQDERILPQYFQDNWAIHLPWGGSGGDMYIMPDLPLMSLVDVTDLGQLGGQLSPFIKLPYEYNAQRQIWKGIPLTDEPQPIPRTMAWLTPAMKALGLVERNTDGELVAPQNALYSIQQFLPQLGQARRLFPSEDRYQDRRMSSWLSYMLGLGLRTNTPDEQMNEVWRRYYDHQNEIDHLRDLGYDTETATALEYLDVDTPTG